MHTPGPWEVVNGAGIGIFSAAPQNHLIAKVMRGISDGHSWENARLIAAAPDLADALLTISTWLTAPALDAATIDEMRQVTKTALIKAGLHPE